MDKLLITMIVFRFVEENLETKFWGGKKMRFIWIYNDISSLSVQNKLTHSETQKLFNSFAAGIFRELVFRILEYFGNKYLLKFCLSRWLFKKGGKNDINLIRFYLLIHKWMVLKIESHPKSILSGNLKFFLVINIW